MTKKIIKTSSLKKPKTKENLILKRLVNDYFTSLKDTFENLQLSQIIEVANILFDAWKKENIIYVVGCGGSASTATHFAADLAKTAIVPGFKRFKAVSLVDNIPLVSAWTNDSGWGSVFSEQLEPWIKKDDILVAFSVHGGSGEGDAGPWSQNLLKAMKLAQKRGAKVIGFSGFSGGAMKSIADVIIIVPQKKEPLATPIIESVHVALHHLFSCLLLKEMIRSSRHS